MASAPPNPNYGQTFTKGIKYLKINRLDKDGEDFGQRLSLADNLRINYPDIGVIQYDILTTQQQGDFYLCGVIPSETTSSLNNIKNYTVSLVKSPASVTLNKFEAVTWVDGQGGGFNVSSGNSGNYYNTTTDVYSFNLSNVPTYVTSSLTVTSVTGTPLYLSVLIPTQNLSSWYENPFSTPGVQVLNQIIIASGNGTYETISSINDIPGGEYYFGGVLISFLDASVTITAASEKISQTQSSFDSPEILVLINPEAVNFDYSDYNAILGNATSPQFSATYQNISYDNGTLAPTNLDYIISGTAERALIQDSNYSQTSWINSRYNGTRVSSLDFNSYTKLTK